MFGSGCYFAVECYVALVWLEVLCWIDSIWSSKECVCCACDPCVSSLEAPSICLFVFWYVGSYLLI